jgi:hypothetical protein
MKAVEFESILAPGGQIALPPEVAKEIPPGEQLRVLLMWEPSDTEMASWRAMGSERFEAAYAPEDDVYNCLIDDPSVR